MTDNQPEPVEACGVSGAVGAGGVPSTHVGDESTYCPRDHGCSLPVGHDDDCELTAALCDCAECEHRARCRHVKCPGGSLCCCQDESAAPVEPVADTEAVETVRAKYDRLRERGEPHDTAFYLATARRERAVVTAQHGWFTVDCGAWLGDPPPRSDLSVSQLADLLRLALDGGPIPERYSYWDAFDVLADLHLVATNTIRSLHERRDLIESETTAARLVRARVQRLVLDAGKRKTLRTDDVRRALAGGEQ